MEAKLKSEELENEPTANIAFVPLAMPSTAGPGTIAMIISSASTVRTAPLPGLGCAGRAADYFCPGRDYPVGLSAQFRAIMRLVGKGGIEAISRLMGFLLVCMGVQFIINGVLEIIKTYHA
jgi:multiple antibiotic resistance protein